MNYRSVRRRRGERPPLNRASAPAIPGPAALLQRPRLFALLDKGAGTPLTLLNAPAGAGKSALAASWVRANDRAAVWVSGAEAREPLRLLAAIGRALSGASGGRGLPVRARHSEQAMLGAVAALANGRPAAEPSGSTLLVVDDVAEPGCAALPLLLRAAPGLRIIACCRRAAGEPLSRLRVDGDLNEIGPGALAFTIEEADELLRLNGVAVDESTVESIVERTGGWATGLCLAARAALPAADPAAIVGRFDGADPTVVDYVRGELMPGLDPLERDLLLRASTTESISADLADSALGAPAGARALERLAAAHLVSPDPRQPGPAGRYRVHPLLRGFLRHEARLQPPAATLVDPISARETVVLRYLPTLLNAREIAAELYVSPNTVKTQLKSVYRKLGVQTRRAAVDRARTLGLL